MKRMNKIELPDRKCMFDLKNQINRFIDELYSFYDNVKEFGAKGNGIVDDTLAIQNALNNSKAIFFPSGTYLIKATGANSTGSDGGLLIPSNIKIISYEDAILKAIPGTKQNSQIFNIKDKSNIEISGLKFIGDWNTRTDKYSHNVAVNIEDGNDIFIHDCGFENTSGDAIRCPSVLKRSKNIRIERCDFTTFRRWGVFLDVDHGIIKDCVFHDCVSDFSYNGGIDIEYQGDLTSGPTIKNIVIEGNKFLNLTTENADGGIVLQSNNKGGYIDNVVVRGNYFENCRRVININGCNNYKFIDNHCINNKSGISLHGIPVVRAFGLIRGNTFCNSGEIRIPTGAGLKQTVPIYGVTVSENIFSDYSTAPIVGSFAMAKGISIINNTFFNCTAYFNFPRGGCIDYYFLGNKSISQDGLIEIIDTVSAEKIFDNQKPRNVITGLLTTGKYEKGEWFIFNDFDEEGSMGLVCLTSGTMTKISGTCSADGTNVLSSINVQPLDSIWEAKITIGDYLLVGDIPVRVLAVNDVNVTITVSENISEGHDIVFSNVPATFKKWGAIVE